MGDRYAIPLVSGGTITFEGPFPVGMSDWDHMMAVLEAMKPGLVIEPPPGTPVVSDEEGGDG